jgi:molybdate transport system substrate-binding protein
MIARVALLGRIALALVALLLPVRAGWADPPGVLVFAAASLKNALDDAVAAYPAARVTVSYAASGALARQIEAGAPAALFISADEEWMDELAAKGLIEAGSRTDLLGNTLVLIAPSASPARFEFGRDTDLAPLLGDGRLAMGDPQSVPAGRYAETALNALGLWPNVATRLARADSVRAALALVDHAEAPLGIVYRTDAMADSAVRVVAEFPDDSHKPIRYPAALIAPAAAPARDFLAWLGSPAAARFFARQGFIVPAR